MQKKTLEDANRLAKEKDGYCLAEEYINASTKMPWECHDRHMWEATYNSIQSGRWCKKCASMMASERYKFSFALVKEEIEKRGGTLLSSKYVNSSTKLDVLCNKCHNIWHPIFASIRQGFWCPICAKEHLSELFRSLYSKVKLDIEVKGGQLLTDHYNNERQKLSILCNTCNLVWTMDYCHIKRGQLCTNCSISKKHTIGDCHEWAAKLGGECLSTEYINCKTNMVWKCATKHIWSATFDNISRGKWCPECKTGKTQGLLKDVLHRIFAGYEIETNYKGFEWLYNRKTKGKQEIDIWIPHIKLAIEYDGEQHFGAIDYFGGENKFKKTKKLDGLKNRKMKKHRNDIRWFIRFGYKEAKMFNEAYIRSRLEKEGILLNGT